MKGCGIYKFYWPKTGHFYIGMSKDLYKRKFQHLFFFKNGLHSNVAQDMYDTNGSPVFEVLEYCHKNILRDKEDFWIDKHREDPLLLNRVLPSRKNDLTHCISLSLTKDEFTKYHSLIQQRVDPRQALLASFVSEKEEDLTNRIYLSIHNTNAESNSISQPNQK